MTGVQPVGDRRQGDQDRRKGGRSLRHRLLDLLMEEVESLPDLSVRQKQRIRRNLDRFAERPPLPPTPMERGPPPAAPPLVEAATPVIDSVEPPVPDQTISVQTDDVISAEELAPLKLVDGMDANQLGQEIERLMALHSEQAVKIASYIQALKTVTPDDHQVDLDI
ncbi:hypothetical protein [Niveispirillum sp. KHB5.9]|uniref:hypothetical protein n=1 Tax=Niveispirillum sp. KHB5.9 TaxID=3400269 RepID=UPI003A8AC188